MNELTSCSDGVKCLLAVFPISHTPTGSGPASGMNRSSRTPLLI
jgi:hypothetical protein